MFKRIALNTIIVALLFGGGMYVLGHRTASDWYFVAIMTCAYFLIQGFVEYRQTKKRQLANCSEPNLLPNQN